MPVARAVHCVNEFWELVPGTDFASLRFMRKIAFLTLAGLFLVSLTSALVASDTHPATIGQGGNSVALQLHYPPKERAQKAEGAVTFYCEVSPAGKAGHISTLCGKGQARFGTTVEDALRRGRFTPAAVDGEPVSVMIGGTVLFMMTDGRPTIAVALATAEKGKIAALSNYVQPQMIESDALLRRKIYTIRDKYIYRGSAHPGAVVLVHVDSQGKPTGKKIATESPVDGGRGRLLLDVVDAERFIPAESNGQRVAGDFELAMDFEHMRNPDSGPATGTLLRDDGY